MPKPIVTKLFLGSLVVIAGGLVLGSVASLVASFVMDGSDVTGVEPTPFAWSMLAIAGIGLAAVAAGAIGQFVAWIGAVVNTLLLPDKGWFILLLLLGLFSFGFVAMIAYLIAGPDGTKASGDPARVARPQPAAAGFAGG